MDERLRHAHLKICAYLFLGALVVRLLYLSQYACSPFFWVPTLDNLYHDLHARALAAGQGEREAFFRAPLYYYFLGGIYWLFGHNLWAPRLIQALLGSASCVLLYLIGGRVFWPTVGLVAGGLMALYGPLVFFDGELLIPPLAVFLDLCFLLLVLRASDGERLQGGRWLAAGGVLGLSAIARPNILLAAPVVVLWIWRYAAPQGELADRRGRLCATVLFLGATLVAPALVTLRNYRVASDPIFIASQGGINFFLGNRPEADGYTPSTPRRYRFKGEYEDSVALYGQRAAEEALGRRLSASQAQAYWLRRGLAWWRDDPVAALRLTWRKWVLTWTHREIRNNHAYDFVRAEFAPILWLCLFGFWFAGPLGLLGMALSWRVYPHARLLALFILTYLASFLPFFVADRYRLPAVPPLLLFAAYALACGWEPLRCRRWHRLAPVAAALTALALFVNVDWYPTATSAAQALDHWSAGNGYLELGRLEEAEARYRKALALDPRNAEIWTNLGAVCYATDRIPEAAACFGEAIRRAPGEARGYFNLALCERDMGHPHRARQHLEAALRLDPEHTAAREELIRLRRSDARPTPAARPMQIARRGPPEHGPATPATVRGAVADRQDRPA
ncbi:MAG: tetratricopeptide repeat protein [Armatimonadetes bacterium]|nr:tetratricopeptide repeat protein [Armatimonadota bacterium]